MRPARSLKQEYASFFEKEIEHYKESIPRAVLLSIGDEAVQSIAAQQQFALTELFLCEKVDEIIAKRLALPGFTAWKRQKLKLAAEQRRPEHWGLSQDDLLVRAVNATGTDTRVLLAGSQVESSALYFAAHGCDVTALGEPDDVQRVLDAAEQAGLGARVHAGVTALNAFTPDAPLTAVIYSPAAFSGLDIAQRARVIQVLQSATADGGVHLVQTIAAGRRSPVSLEELQRRYRGWDVTVDEGISKSFFARKARNDMQV